MANNNQWIILSGRLGKDVERKTSRKGTPYLSFSVATNVSNDTIWYNVLVFNSAARPIEKYFKKGDLIELNAEVIGKNTLKVLDFGFPLRTREKPAEDNSNSVDDFPFDIDFDEVEEIEL